MNQRDELIERLNDVSEPIINSSVLAELVYTANETGVFGDEMSADQILKAWKLITIAQSLGDRCPQELRM